MTSSRTERRNVAKSYALVLIATWTLLIFASYSWNSRVLHENNIEKARIEARTFYDLTLAYRHWSASQGGVYVPVTETQRPNPYLDVPERDITTTTGKKLTLVNPAWMTRQVFDILNKDSGASIVSRLVSSNYLNPVNRPDAWESAGLGAFERGEREVSDVTVIRGESFLRLMIPFVAEQPCLHCHARQGYKLGDIRGGLSISVPLAHHIQTETHERRTLLATLSGIWLIGTVGILFFYRRVARHERQIIESEEKYRVLFENNPTPMWVYDLETLRFLAVNDAAVEHYGYARGEFLAMTIRDIRPIEDIAPLLENVARVTAGIDRAGTWRHRKKDGTIIIVEITSHTVDFGGRRAEIVLASDVTERHRLEDQLRQAQKMEAVGLLAGGVAHDFNNVLTAIIGYGNLLHMKLPQDDQLHSYAESILMTAQRAAQLTQSLLAFGRKQVINPVPVQLNSIIERISKLLKRLIREDVDLQVSLTGEDTTILADSVQLEQVLMNLATNARDAMPQGGMLRISSAVLEVRRDLIASHGTVPAGQYVLLTVADNGIGMDDRTRERLFEPFFTTKEMGKGTGLGLASTYGIIRQHKGIVDVDSRLGEGTVFHLYFPLFRAAAPESTAAAVRPARGGSETILVAEDDEMLLNLTRSVLTEFGYTVIEAHDGEDAVRLFRESPERIDLLLSDVIMPKKNGKDALREMREVRPGLKALFISGYSADILSKEGILDENIDVISKPVSPVELLQKIRQVLDR